MDAIAARLAGQGDNFNGRLVLLIVLAALAGCGDHGTEPVSPASYLAGSTIISSQDSLVADGTTKATITVELKDSLGRAAHSSTGVVAIEATAGSLTSVVDHNDGTYSASFTSPKLIGAATISARLNGAPLAKSKLLTLVAGPVDIQRSSIESSNTAVFADGIDVSRVYVNARDANDNPTESGVTRVTIATTFGTLGAMTTESSGRYYNTLKSDTKGAAVVTATIDDRALPSITIRFVGGFWVKKTSLPAERQVFAIGVHDGILYTVGGGGWTTESYSSEVNAYDPATNRWTARAPMPTARGELAAGVVGGVLYAVGGYKSTDLSTVEAYDIAADRWTVKTPMPTAREGLAVAVVNGILYAIGGNTRGSSSSSTSSSSAAVVAAGPPKLGYNLQSAEHALGTVEAYDPATDSWTVKASMPTPRSMLGVGVVNGIIYAVGGASGGEQSRTVEAYDPATNSWTGKADMPTRTPSGLSNGRAALSVGVVNDMLYAVGGFVVYLETDLVDVYDPSKDLWAPAQAMPTMRQSLGVGVIDGILYAVGGACYDDTFDLVEAFVP